jgi:FtsH-binding integral membrane protein
MMANPSLAAFVKATPAVHIMVMVGSFAALFALFAYKDRHPLNLAILALWTTLISITVGTACSLYAPTIVLQGLILTSGVVVGLTGYTFWAVRRGHDFTHWGTYLFTTLWAFLLFGFMQILLPVSDTMRAIYAFMGTLLFSGYLVYDTNMLITKHSVDEYIWASVELYLDMINMFLYILEILNRWVLNPPFRLLCYVVISCTLIQVFYTKCGLSHLLLILLHVFWRNSL